MPNTRINSAKNPDHTRNTRTERQGVVAVVLMRCGQTVDVREESKSGRLRRTENYMYTNEHKTNARRGNHKGDTDKYRCECVVFVMFCRCCYCLCSSYYSSSSFSSESSTSPPPPPHPPCCHLLLSPYPRFFVSSTVSNMTTIILVRNSQ